MIAEQVRTVGEITLIPGPERGPGIEGEWGAEGAGRAVTTARGERAALKQRTGAAGLAIRTRAAGLAIKCVDQVASVTLRNYALEQACSSVRRPRQGVTGYCWRQMSP